MKFKILIILFFSSFTIISNDIQERYVQQINNDYNLRWNGIDLLKWSNFKGAIDEECVSCAAVTYYVIKVLSISRINGVPKYKIACLFSQNKSWTKVTDIETLKHEQLHFDIGELHVRKIRKEIDRLNKIGETDYHIYNDVYMALANQDIAMSKKYDSEVYFNDIRQQQWINRIHRELIKYNKYSFENCYIKD